MCLIAILLILLLGNPCKIVLAYGNPFYGFNIVTMKRRKKEKHAKKMVSLSCSALRMDQDFSLVLLLWIQISYGLDRCLKVTLQTRAQKLFVSFDWSLSRGSSVRRPESGGPHRLLLNTHTAVTSMILTVI